MDISMELWRREMTKTMKKIEVAYICDKSYALTTLVSLRSLKKYRAPNIYYLVHMIVAGFEQKKEKDIIHIFQKEAVEHEIDIVIHQIQHEQNDAIFTHRYVSKAALIKFRLPHILENVNRILYLDGDTLIRSGLEDICEADIEQCYAAVVEDMSVSMSEHRKELGLIHYFNSGVMYLNLEKMRTDHVEKMLIQQKKKEKQQLYMDQDAFNVVLGHNVIYLHPRFNLIYDMYRKYTLYEIASFYNISEHSVDELEQSACILHMAGDRKPWKEQESEQLVEWLSYIKSFKEFAVCEKAYYNKQLAFEVQLQKETHERKNEQQNLEKRILDFADQEENKIDKLQEETIAYNKKMQKCIAEWQERTIAYSQELQNRVTELENKLLVYEQDMHEITTGLDKRISFFECSFIGRIWKYFAGKKKDLQ